MKVLAFAGSNTPDGINNQLLDFALSRTDAEVTKIDLNDFEMPIYSKAREAEGGVPEAAQRFKRLIGEADVVVMSLAVHNGTYAVAYKNVFDWASRLEGKVYDGVRVILLSASPGPMAGQPLLDIAATGIPRFGGALLGTLGVGKFAENFQDGALVDVSLLAQLDELMGKI